MEGPDAGEEWRREEFPRRVNRRALRLVLAAGRRMDPAALRRMRALNAAQFLERLRLMAEKGNWSLIVEAAAGEAPLGLALSASLSQGPRLICLDQDPAALRAAAALAAELELTVEFHRSTIGDFLPPPGVALVMAVHACGWASLEAVDLACRAEARSVVLVPCCGPPGAAGESGLANPPPEEPALQAELDRLGLLMLCQARLVKEGFRTETFPVFLPPWRTREIGLAAYRDLP